MWRRTSSLHIPGYLISPLMGWPIKIIHELRRFLRLLLLNIRYLRYQFLSKSCRKKLLILNTLPVRGDPFIHIIYRRQKSDEIVQKNIMDFEYPTLTVGYSCLISTINTSNHAELLKLQTHLHHAELQPINTGKIAANLGWMQKWLMTNDHLKYW